MLATVFHGGEIENNPKLKNEKYSLFVLWDLFVFLVVFGCFLGAFVFEKVFRSRCSLLKLKKWPPNGVVEKTTGENANHQISREPFRPISHTTPEFCATQKKVELLEDSNHVQLLLFRVDLQLHFHQLLLFLFISQAIFVQLQSTPVLYFQSRSSIFRGNPKKSQLHPILNDQPKKHRGESWRFPHLRGKKIFDMGKKQKPPSPGCPTISCQGLKTAALEMEFFFDQCNLRKNNRPTIYGNEV